MQDDKQGRIVLMPGRALEDVFKRQESLQSDGGLRALESLNNVKDSYISDSDGEGNSSLGSWDVNEENN